MTRSCTQLPRTDSAGYDPWRDLADNWPEVRVVQKPMNGSLLGVLRYPVIALRAGTSAAQRRCTLAHEIVHLERGVGDCGPFAAQEERQVHTEAARRLAPVAALAAALRGLGAEADLPRLAQALDVDGETLRLRLETLTRAERRKLRAVTAQPIWRIA